MKLSYHNKEIELLECKSFKSRFLGFMGQKNISKCLYFNHCNCIHTFFMMENIDVIFCDKFNNILYYYKDLSPNKIILPKKKVTKVYELPVHYFDFKINEKIELIFDRN